MSFTVALVDDGDVFPTPAETKRFTFFTAHTKRNNKKKKKRNSALRFPGKGTDPILYLEKILQPLRGKMLEIFQRERRAVFAALSFSRFDRALF